MKARMSLKNIIFVIAIIILASMFFINICFATNNGKISVDTAKLREQPNTEAKILELISNGEEVKILEEKDGWYKVEYKQITGYLRTDLVETSNKKEELESNINETNEQTTQSTENVVPQTTTETNVEPVQEQGIEQGKQYKILANIRLKTIPLISAIELDEVIKDAQVEVIEILNDWAKIKTVEGKEGWTIKGNLVTIQPSEEQTTVQTTTNLTQPENTQQVQKTKKMYVNSQTINLRAEASKTSQTIKQLALNTEVTVLTTVNGWAYVEVNGIKGYISESLLSSTKKETSRSSTTERGTTKTNTPVTNNTVNTPVSSNSSSKGSAVVAYAQQFLGCAYKYAGTSPSGFDCSGFTQYVYKNFGVTLNRTAAAQYSNGTAVTDLQPGDLLMFGKPSINHVGIYIGGNQFIHAANPSKGVRIDSISSSYYKSNYRGARRIF